MKTRDIAPYGIRMPAELKEKVQERAKANGRSMNAEIVNLIEDALKKDDFENEGALDTQSTVKALEDAIKSMVSVIEVQDTTIALAKEQIALLKHHIKISTGFDVQDFLNKSVDYEGIYSKHGLDYKDFKE